MEVAEASALLIGPGANLAGIDRTGQDLTGMDLTGAILNGVVLTSVNLTCTDLTNAKLVGAEQERVREACSASLPWSVLGLLQSRIVRLMTILRLRWRLKPKTTKPLPPLHSDRRATHGRLTNKREKAYIKHVQVINNRLAYPNA